jgi:hypothetical protein
MGEDYCKLTVGKGSPHKEAKMTIRGHEKSHNRRKKDAKDNGKGKKMSQEVLDKEMAVLKASVDAIIMLLEDCERGQRYGWTMKKKKIKWKMLQIKIKRRMYARLREELRAAELKVEDDYCRPKQKVYLDEEGIIDNFLTYWTSSDQQGDVMIKTSKEEEPCIFETNALCMFAGDEQSLEDVFMQVDEEMKLLEEMAVIEQVFKDTEDGQLLKTIMEDEDDESRGLGKKMANSLKTKGNCRLQKKE